MMNRVIKLMWKLYSLDLQYSAAPLLRRGRRRVRPEEAIKAQPSLFEEFDILVLFENAE